MSNIDSKGCVGCEVVRAVMTVGVALNVLAVMTVMAVQGVKIV